MLKLRLLGEFQLFDGDIELRIPATKQRGLLAYLGYQADRPQLREHLTELLWGSHFEARARQNFRQALAQLRRIAGKETIQSDTTHLFLNRLLIDTDVAALKKAHDAGEQKLLEAAIPLWGGEFLAGLNVRESAFQTWATTTRTRTREQFINIASKLAQLHLRQNDPEAALNILRRAIALDPLREDLRLISISALARASRRSEAIQEFTAFEALLQRELGARPETATYALVETIKFGGSSPSATSFGGAHEIGRSESPEFTGCPMIAVLPFDDPDAGRGNGYFATGMADEIIARLPRIAKLDVMSRSTGLAISQKSGDPKELCRSVGARYVLTGSARRIGENIRIFVELFETERGTSLWNNRFDGSQGEVFDFLDDAAERVVAAIEPAIQRSELQVSAQKRPSDLRAFDYYLRALPLVHAMTHTGSDEALKLLDKALSLESDFADAAGLAAWCRALRRPQGWMQNPQSEVAEGLELAFRATTAQPQSPEALATGGYSKSFLGSDPHAGLKEIERALVLNPSLAQGWTFGGWVHLYVGNIDRAGRYFERALFLNPLDPLNYRTQTGLAFQKFFLGQFEPAVELAEEAIAANPNFSVPYRAHAAALAMLGDTAGAKITIGNLRRLVPGSNLADYANETRFRSQPYLTNLLKALKLAGLPAGSISTSREAGSPRISRQVSK